AAGPAAAPPKPRPAANPVTLQLQADGRQVAGWVSGTRDLAGREVTVRLGGKAEKRTLEKGNTFRWAYKVDKPATAEFSLAGLRGSVALAPPPAAPGPCVFFVVDRTAYRPGQALHFAGFLRREGASGEFAPVAG